MADLPNRNEIFAVGRRSLRSAPVARLNPALVDIAGSDLNLLMGAGSLMGEEIVRAFAMCVRGLFVETARADQLDRVAFDRYGLTRFPANAATTTLSLERPTALAGGGTIAAGSRVQTLGGVQFATNVDVVFGGGDLVKTVAATALLSGPEGNVGASAVTTWVDGPFDNTITLHNTTAAAGGADVETDALFRGRIYGFFPTVRRGTLGAIEFGATQVAGVAVAKAFEILSPTSFPAAFVQLVVSDAAGGSSPTMLQAVRDILLTYRAGGIPVQVSGGTVVLLSSSNLPPDPIIWKLAYKSGIDSVQAQEDVRAVTVAAMQYLAPGATLHRSTLIAAARTVPGVIVGDGALVAPAGDIVPVDNTKILRVLAQDVVFT